MDFSISQQDGFSFVVTFVAVYIGMNVYNKENENEADYTKSFQYAFLGSLIAIIVSMMYSKNSKGEIKLDEPFNSLN